MDKREFLNRLRGLHCLDDVPGISPERQSAFVRDPVRFLMKADDATGDAVWEALVASQAPRERRAA